MHFDAIDEIIVVPQFHYDIAYLQTEEQYYPRCFDNFRQAIALMEANSEYRYTIEQPFLIEAFEKRCHADFERLKACHERGQLEVSGALYLIPDMNMPCGEALIRQVLHGRRYVRETFGADVRIAWIADTWGHAPTLPQIMTHAGIDTYFFSRGMRPEIRIGDFAWTGLDGTTIVTHWLPQAYAAIRFPSEAEIENALELDMAHASDENLRNVAEGLRNLQAQGTVLLCNGGDMAPPQASAPRVMRDWQSRGLPVRFGTIRDYADALHHNADKLPAVSADFNPLFIGTQASRIKLKQNNRKLENALLSLEALDASLRLSGGTAAALNIDDAWKLCLKGQFHDIISGTLVDAAYHDAMRDYETAFAAVARAEHALTGGGEIAVFNPSGFARDEWVETAAGAGRVKVEAFAWAPLPPKAASSTDTPVADSADVSIENEYWRVTVGPSGTVTSCVDVATGAEYVAGSWGNLVYRADNGDLWLLDRSPLGGGSIDSQLTEPGIDDPFRLSADPLVSDSLVRQETRRHRRTLAVSPGQQKVTVTGSLTFWINTVGFETTISLRAGDPLIHFHTVCKPHGRRYRVYATFGTPWADATPRHSIPFGAIERDANRYAGQNWTEALDAASGDGVRVLNAGVPGHAVIDGNISLLLFRSVAMEYKAKSDDAYEDGETLTFDYAVRPFTAAAPGHAEREGERVNRPLVVVAAPATLPTVPPVTVTPDNVHIDAFYVARNGDTILRVHESTGKPATGTISFAKPPAAVRQSDGCEAVGRPVALAGGAIALTLRAWEIATWRVRW